jgi:hypothetical protein
MAGSPCRRSPPRRDSLDLDLEGETENRSDHHDEAERGTFSMVGAIATVRTRSAATSSPRPSKMIPPKDSRRTLYALRPPCDEWYDRTARTAQMSKPPRSTRAAIPRRVGQRVPLTRKTSSHDTVTGRGNCAVGQCSGSPGVRLRYRSLAACGRPRVELAVVRCRAVRRASSLFVGC